MRSDAQSALSEQLAALVEQLLQPRLGLLRPNQYVGNDLVGDHLFLSPCPAGGSGERTAEPREEGSAVALVVEPALGEGFAELGGGETGEAPLVERLEVDVDLHAWGDGGWVVEWWIDLHAWGGMGEYDEDEDGQEEVGGRRNDEG